MLNLFLQLICFAIPSSSQLEAKNTRCHILSVCLVKIYHVLENHNEFAKVGVPQIKALHL